MTRVYTNIHAAICYRNEDNGKIIYQTLSQVDLKMKVPPLLVSQIIPKAAREWHKNVNAYYKKNEHLLGKLEV